MVFGILVSLGLIAVSVALNFRMGFRSADTELDGKLYGAGAAFGDSLKAIAPFMMSWGFRNGDVLAAISAVMLFSICTVYSFVSALGFAAEHRANKAGSAQVALDGYGDLRAEKKRLEQSLTFYGPQRSPTEVEDAIAAKLKERTWTGGRTVGALSSDCTVDRKSTRAACETVAKLNVELSAAREVERLNNELRTVMGKSSAQGAEAPSTADAQVDALAGVVHLVTEAVTKDHIGLGLSILLACFVEVGSGVGLFMVTTPWRAKAAAVEGKPGSKRMLGHVDAYMLARIGPGEGMLSMKTLHEDYIRWCLRTHLVAYAEAEFAKRFVALADEAGLQITTRGQREYCRQVRLAEG
ncbi:hypothetical protein [Hyphomicrobium sp.]|uniref:hypothetical protein n=1 Tax=Hyphomicrobium sp. TaxID=82 RepID=UPI002E33CAF9|nr:hypothetical protein [Hyphomicrobium sp.]HEX2842058.1 hypothetical protein [Hyphomicrobium sp.]